MVLENWATRNGSFNRNQFFSEQLTVNRLKTMDKLMQMLLLVVQQPGNLGLTLLPSILEFSLNYVMPLLMQTQTANEFCDVVMSLFQLLDG